ncbi:MAG: aminotransferase class III-fold pyridoxal phosphate-dependent enzyme [Acetobacteraceae bacterium]|nr:aminotransferase class III-fold pyridoxal phosphate-dependent enzyme [Acetobacteraceae bacterium]
MAELPRNDKELELVALARRVLPGGSFGNLTSDIVIAEGRGGRVWDVSGNEYVDFLLGSGPLFAGHCHPDVVAAVQAQIPRGVTFFANSEPGIRLAAAIVDAVPCAEQVRFTSTGTEADAYAMRLARAHRGRDKILKFEGGFHGMGEYSLQSLAPKRPGNFPQATPDSPGIPRSVSGDMLVAPFNDPDLAASLIREHRDELAGVIVEPFQRLIPPRPGFLQALRAVTAECEIPLIFDEIVTGFRFAYGGAQEYYGVVPDICTLGKIVAGGFPLAGVCGRADIMRHFDRAAMGDAVLPQVGTLSGNPLASAAGLATLEVLRRPGTYEAAFATGRKLMEGLATLVRAAGLPAQVIGMPVLFDLIFVEGEVVDYRSTLRADAAALARFNRSVREAGVLKGDSKCYISIAHTEADVQHALGAFAHAVEQEVAFRRAA